MGRQNIHELDRPLYQEVATAAVGAGVDATYTFPTDKFVRILAVHTVLVSDATVIARTMILNLASALTGFDFDIVAPFDHNATNTISYNFGGGHSFNLQTVRAGVYTVGFPHRIILSPGATIATEVDNLQAGDNVTVLDIIWHEWQALHV